MNKIRFNDKLYVDTPRPLTKKTRKFFRNAISAKKHFCYNFFKNKFSIGLWDIPDTKYQKYPKLTFANFKSYIKIGFLWKKYLLEIVWNKWNYTF
jgi:hypothetical protein